MALIQYIENREIDKQQWDACITNSDNGLIYATSEYLDAMSHHWDALVLDDYKAVMPLTWKRKYGMRYLCQPFFAAALGVFGNNISAGLINDFLLEIPAKFKYWDIYLNHGNFFRLKDFTLYQRMNYVLPLDKNYADLYAGYRENIKRNIKKSKQLNCETIKDFPVEDVINLAAEQSKNFSPVTADDYERFKGLYYLLHSKKQAITYGIMSADKELLASCVCVFFKKRATYILVGNHPTGKTIGASHALIDAFIKDYSASDLLLDFEGSDVSSLAFFYSSFGSVEEKYAGIKLNKLPKLLRYFKK